MSETSSIVSLTSAKEAEKSTKRAYESIGRAVPFTEVKVIDPVTKRIVPYNVDGELCVRGYNVMKE